MLQHAGVDTMLGGEFEAALVDWRAGGEASPGVNVSLARQQFLVPDRAGLPPLGAYAHLVTDGATRRVGYTEASRGCKHLCRHCPVVPVYQGVFRIVQQDVVLEDIRRQVAAGAEHITFGDPDFFNGPGHAMPIVEALHREWPGLTYDVTIKIEHLLKHRDLLPLLQRDGLPVRDQRGGIAGRRGAGKAGEGPHARRFRRSAAPDARRRTWRWRPPSSRSRRGPRAKAIANSCGRWWIWTWPDQVAPIQLAIRLLIPEGSLLLELPEVRAHHRALRPERPSATPGEIRGDGQALRADPGDDQARRAAAESRRMEIFRKIWDLAEAGEWPVDTPMVVAGDDPVSDRALVLLSGANRRAVSSCVMPVNSTF